MLPMETYHRARGHLENSQEGWQLKCLGGGASLVLHSVDKFQGWGGGGTEYIDSPVDRVTGAAKYLFYTALREGDIRLVGQGPQNEGILEFYSREHGWATLCTSDWDDSDAQVACSQLGYEGGKSNTSRFA